VKRLDQLAKGIDKTRLETNLNTRRVQANFPLVERKLDVVSGDYGFNMDFPLTKHDHSARLTLKVKPDNCCECDPGAQTVIREAIGYFFESIVPEGFTDGVAYPARIITDGEAQTFYGNPLGLVQTGTTFNYGYDSPFFHTIYQDFPYIGGYSVSSDRKIVVPVDGMYSVFFTSIIDGGSIGGPDASLIISIRQTTIEEGEEVEYIISKRTYSVAKGNLTPGSHVHHMINLENREEWTMLLYSYCIPLFAGDKVDGYIQVTNLPNFSTHFGWGDNDNSLKVNLLGLGFGYLIGYVYDFETGLPLEGATVSYSNGFGDSTTTDEFGAYAFYDLRPATYTVTASSLGYVTQTQTVTVYFNKISQIDFNLNT
jgi:hypothetical protein